MRACKAEGVDILLQHCGVEGMQLRRALADVLADLCLAQSGSIPEEVGDGRRMHSSGGIPSWVSAIGRRISRPQQPHLKRVMHPLGFEGLVVEQLGCLFAPLLQLLLLPETLLR